MTASPVRSVVVGIDATPDNDQVLDWAADQAALRTAPLHIAHAWSLAPYQLPPGDRGDIAEQLLQAARQQLHRAEGRVRERYSSIEVSSELLTDGAVPGLVRTSEHADLLVVGTRGRNRLASTLLGSVSQGLAAHADCPVVVLAGPPQASAPGHGAVVLGAAPGEAAAPVTFAFAEASRRSVPLRVIRTWLYPQAYPGIFAVPPVEKITRTREENEDLAEVLAAGRKEFPDVQVITEVTLDEADAALVDASAGACLVVVGAERHQRRFAMPLGPVTQRVLHHAHSPIAVVPHP
ncbi:nucleotide-binding universal stress UspA family protein [Streptacidiphilus sp. MAP12-16]|uniref:universal stress protein n=1 Tax=Streptacidiphilus sp. MAP12-16 TaxID=3156300 RepID=UPI0035181056